MANIYDYVSWRGDLEFYRDPFNPVDNAIFSQLAYLPMDDFVPGPGDSRSISIEKAGKISEEKYRKYLSAFNDDITISLGVNIMQAVREAPRFKNCELFGFVNNIDFIKDKQFSAYCARISRKRSPGITVVVFRGTDLNLAGWKEDMNMSFSNTIPAQKEAVSYLEKMSERFPDPIIVTGHSKGGNLAIYASAFCSEATQKRINAVYSNDGPGFHEKLIQSRGYQAILGRIQAFIPQSSLVGMLFEHGETPAVVKSTAIGLMQHDMSSWKVASNNFVKSELTSQSLFTDKVLRDWLNRIDEEQKEVFIETIYRVITAGNAQSLNDIPSDIIGTISGVISTVKNMDAKTKKIVQKIIRDLFKVTGKNLRDRISRAEKGLLSGTH